jgi:hypothetical protein
MLKFRLLLSFKYIFLTTTTKMLSICTVLQDGCSLFFFTKIIEKLDIKKTERLETNNQCLCVTNSDPT